MTPFHSKWMGWQPPPDTPIHGTDITDRRPPVGRAEADADGFRSRWPDWKPGGKASVHSADKADKNPSVSSVSSLNGHIEGKPTPPEQVEWSAEEWEGYYHERAGIREHEGEQPRPVAEAAAFEECVDEWLRQNPPPAAQPNRCAQCGNPDDGKGQTVLLSKGGHTWLHHRCYHAWNVRRRKEAVTALACVDPLTADER